MNACLNTEKPLDITTEKDPRWAAVVARDREADGKFYYSVKTTGVCCRPSCASRLAKPENVQFHATCADAEQAGFRPCKRCKPDQPSLVQQHAAKVAEMCRLIEGAEETPSLSELSSKAGLSAELPSIIVVSHPRTRPVRKPLAAPLPCIEVIHDLSEAEKLLFLTYI